MGYFLDSTLRKKFQPPEKVVKRSEIKKGTDVLEVGCGSGAFTTCAARAVGKDGKVYALDIEPKMLKQLENKLNKPKNQDIKNVKLVKGSACNLPFKNKSLDLVFMATVLQEIPNKNKALKEIRRVLKPGGILAVTEFLPDPDYPFKSTTIKLGNRAGFVLDNVSGSFWNYTVRFVNPPSQG
ncbi:dimethylmenaquinone methyltransferase [Candidatus Curtissbacteria bacterium RBG_16_39_7]|uniref:Dimethylmenaquinone methyltransferase n=1 Tax=Candidatus Curtissbacteria bacterium RBG_16_39_7 TaxID=1797707 RepID=A0A1F5G525_9BACT|nr:MAG: dimethylmenaquinone methyltransferase [Candidatus Curtissbacteria bacterium RBG_16_39_7]